MPIAPKFRPRKLYKIDCGCGSWWYVAPVRNEDAGGSMLRLLKFYGRGYRAPLDTIGGVVARLAKGLTYPDVEPWMCEKEASIALELTKHLLVVDPNVDPTHDAHLPSDREVAD